MKVNPKRKVFRSLCKSYKRSDGGVHWHKVANEFKKLPSYKDFLKSKDKCEKCGK